MHGMNSGEGAWLRDQNRMLATGQWKLASGPTAHDIAPPAVADPKLIAVLAEKARAFLATPPPFASLAFTTTLFPRGTRFPRHFSKADTRREKHPQVGHFVRWHRIKIGAAKSKAAECEVKGWRVPGTASSKHSHELGPGHGTSTTYTRHIAWLLEDGRVAVFDTTWGTDEPGHPSSLPFGPSSLLADVASLVPAGWRPQPLLDWLSRA